MLEIRETQVYRGPNIWTRMPAIHLVVALGELEERPTNLIPGFTDRLTALIPSLSSHYCSRGHTGGFIERLREGTWMGHVAEHVAIEVQNLAGADVGRGKTRESCERGVYHVVYEYDQEDVGLAAGEFAVRLLNHLIYDTEPGFDFAHELEEQVITVATRYAYGPSTADIVREAERRKIPVIRLDRERSLVQLGYGSRQKRIWATVTSDTSDVAVDLAADKEMTNRILDDVGIPVPRSAIVYDADEAVAEAESMGYPVVLKPSDGNHGRGVCINLADEAAVRHCFPLAAAESRSESVMVETFVSGKDFRILVVNNAVIAVAERVPAHVIGDGAHTVRQLVEITNADPRRGLDHAKILTRISIDEQTLSVLEHQGLTLDDVPSPGQFVQLKLTGNMSTGGTSIDRTDEIHPDTAEIAREAAMVLGLDVAGIDLITADITLPLKETGGEIVEVNAGPGFRMHTHPTEGHSRHVGRAVVDMLFPPGAQSRIPIFAVTGTNGKTTVIRMIASIMTHTGMKVGMTTTDGITIAGTPIAFGDMSGPQSARMVLKNPNVDCAVLETARGGILREGLGFDRCDIAVVTNISSDHLGLGGIQSVEDLANVKAVVPQSVWPNGCSVLNADDPLVVKMAETARGEIIFFSMSPDSPLIGTHVDEHGRAVVLRDTPDGEMITLLEPGRETSVVLAREIPATFGGRARVNIANALAAIGAAIGADVRIEQIRETMRAFTTDFAQVPGRFNLVEVAGRQVLMDYGHNLAALQGMVDFVQRLNAPRSVAMITVPGDRRDDDVRAFGDLAARSFDELVIYDNNSLRGRAPREIPEMLRQIAIDAGMPAERITIVLKELDAAWAAVEHAAPGELALLFVDKPAKIWESLTRSSRTQSLTKHDGHLHAPASHDNAAHDGILVPLHLPASAPQPIAVENIPDQ
jgi:cyanophycin synthetase